MAKGGDLRMLFGALVGVGLGGVALLTVVPVIGPHREAAKVPGQDAAPAAGLEVDDGPAAGGAPEAGAVLAPRFDTVRIAPDGSGLVAGQAAPGAAVAVLAGDEVAAESTADADGRFVAFLELAPSAQPRALSLRDGSGGLSAETVIVAPTGAASDADATATPGSGRPVSSVAGAEAPTRDLPLDQPAPELAQAGDVAAGFPGDGGTDTAGDVAPGGSVADPDGSSVAEASGDEAGAAGPRVAAAGPNGAGAPGSVAATEGPGTGDGGPTVALAVTGPAPSSVDAPPSHAGAPAVDDSPVDLAAAGESSGQAAVLLSDPEGVRVLQPALAPGASAEELATVALDAIAYGDEGEVLLSGRASGGGSVRVYLDNRPVGDTPVGADGQWSARIAGAEAGTYTLRVDQLDPQGEVTSRIETPFLREAESDLADLVGRAQEAGQSIAMRTVQPGNTLWAIARDRYGEPLMYVQVFEMNRDRIRDPDLIYPGQVFVLPATAGR